jgi:hypothetical protein
MRADDSIGKPLAEWAYATPRYPGGLGVSDLRMANESIQRETVLVWFMANLKPSKPAPDPSLQFAEADRSRPTRGPIRGSRFARFGQGTRALSPLPARAVLQEQFEGDIHDALIQALGVELGDNWMWIEPDELAPSTTDASFPKASLQADLDVVEGIIRSLLPEHGVIGHNAPDGETPLTPEEQADVLAAIKRIREGLTADPTKAEEVRAGALGLAEGWQKLGRYILRQADLFVTEANKAVAQKVPHLMGATIIGWDRIGHLLARIWQLLAQLPPPG